jgi:hypothetical protein
MPINRLLEGGVFGPEDIKVLNDAYESALRALHLGDRNDPLTELVAKKIIEVRQRGIRDPAQISKLAIKALGLPEAP